MTTNIQTAETSDIFEITVSTIPFSSVQSRVFWGWMSDGEMLTEAQIIVLQQSGDFIAGQPIVADFRPANSAPKYLFMAERASQPIKTKWYATAIDQGSIGPNEAFTVIGVVNGWRLYRSVFKTHFSSTTEFRTE